MKLVLKDGTAIELALGNNQNQFIVNYASDIELAEIEALLTEDNLSDAHYEINGQVTDTLKNKVLSGSNRNIITRKVTYYLVDAKTAEIERLKATVEEQGSTITEMSDLVDMLLVSTLEPVDGLTEEATEEPAESEVVADVQ